MRVGYNPKLGRIKTDAKGVTIDRGFIAHYQIPAEAAVGADTDGVHEAVACSTPAVGASVTVRAASDPGDTLTISAPASIGADANELSVLLETADGDNLAVTKDDEEKQIIIALADSTAGKNTAALIQAAIRVLTEVGGVDVSGFTCTAGGSWDSAAVASGETGPVPFEGGQTAAPDILTEGLTNPDVPRNITATVGGTAGDIAAVSVIVEGTNFAGDPITETLPAFTENTVGTVAGSKAFRTVTKVTIPAHDGSGATTEIGWGDKLGLPYALQHNTVLAAYHDNTPEVTPPTVVVDAEELEKNTFDLNTALNGKQVDVYLIV